jgi:COG3959: transketolase, N-terminal subunit
MITDIKELEMKVQEIKYKCLELCVKAGQGHVTSAFSAAEIVVSLYYSIMNYKVEDPNWDERDRFIMSKNHGSVITYPILQDVGFIDKDNEIVLMGDGSVFGAHSKDSVPGVEFSGGSLGIGLGVACGMAYAGKMKKSQSRYFTIVGDGECYEGSIWESLMFAGHNQLNNLVMFVDRNQMTVTDYTEHMLKLEPLRDKISAFGFETWEIDGHNVKEIIESVNKTGKTNKPNCIICNTIKGNGISCMSNKMFKHGVAPSGIEAEKAFDEIREKMDNGI